MKPIKRLMTTLLLSLSIIFTTSCQSDPISQGYTQLKEQGQITIYMGVKEVSFNDNAYNNIYYHKFNGYDINIKIYTYDGVIDYEPQLSSIYLYEFRNVSWQIFSDITNIETPIRL